MAACEAPSEPLVRADTRPSAARVAGAQGGADVRLITMKDACDRQSFGAADVDCLRNGGILFDKFIGQLGKHAIMRAWHFAPSVVHAKVGQTLMAVNRGGEEHTFTEVEEFGGGIVPALNALTETRKWRRSVSRWRTTTSSSPAGSTPTTRWRNQAPSCTSAAFTRGCGQP